MAATATIAPSFVCFSSVNAVMERGRVHALVLYHELWPPHEEHAECVDGGALFRPHESRPWNPLVAHVFYLRGIIEQWGRGIQQMVDLMTQAGLPRPEIEESAG